MHLQQKAMQKNAHDSKRNSECRVKHPALAETPLFPPVQPEALLLAQL
ncbi:hypothetical protein CSB92_0396 [Pseudomonas aeruginosa]|nr:hypothetical protein CSC27_4185 [Pseudomonas aeruginosa]PRW17115.1 hypothetical protein CSB92_0396 [Pseudomonas aeruginosa]|tara:strand:+ start:565 stop:708 length:144 start_codon:yes stop_codon:yes gene_type:complete